VVYLVPILKANVLKRKSSVQTYLSTGISLKKFEESKGVFRNRKSKEKEQTIQWSRKKKDKMTNNDLQYVT